MTITLTTAGWIMFAVFLAVVSGAFAWAAWRGVSRSEEVVETTGDFDDFVPSGDYDHPVPHNYSFEEALSAPGVAAE